MAKRILEYPHDWGTTNLHTLIPKWDGNPEDTQEQAYVTSRSGVSLYKPISAFTQSDMARVVSAMSMFENSEGGKYNVTPEQAFRYIYGGEVHHKKPAIVRAGDKALNLTKRGLHALNKDLYLLDNDLGSDFDDTFGVGGRAAQWGWNLPGPLGALDRLMDEKLFNIKIQNNTSGRFQITTTVNPMPARTAMPSNKTSGKPQP